MIVVGSNVVAYLYLPSEHSARAEALLERDPDWAAPVLWRSEFRNILAGYLRREAISFEQAVSLQQLALRARRFGLICSEEAYQALRRDPGAAWQPTDLRVAQANRPPQVVYRWGGAP